MSDPQAEALHPEVAMHPITDFHVRRLDSETFEVLLWSGGQRYWGILLPDEEDTNTPGKAL